MYSRRPSKKKRVNKEVSHMPQVRDQTVVAQVRVKNGPAHPHRTDLIVSLAKKARANKFPSTTVQYQAAMAKISRSG